MAKGVLAIRPGDIGIETPANTEPRTGLSMGEHMAITAKKWGITREAQDQLAAASHQNLAAAYDRGFFDDLMTSYLGLAKDQNLRPDSSVEKLADAQAGLRQGRERDDDGRQLHAAHRRRVRRAARRRRSGPPSTSSPSRRGSSTARSRRSTTSTATRGCSWLPRMPSRACSPATGSRSRTSTTTRSTRPSPPPSCRRSRRGRTRSSAPSASASRSPSGSIDRSRLNVNGSSLAAGHPFAATGGRIVATLAKMLHEKGPGSRGLISICAAGGQGVVAILEGA